MGKTIHLEKRFKNENLQGNIPSPHVRYKQAIERALDDADFRYVIRHTDFYTWDYETMLEFVRRVLGLQVDEASKPE